MELNVHKPRCLLFIEGVLRDYFMLKMTLLATTKNRATWSLLYSIMTPESAWVLESNTCDPSHQGLLLHRFYNIDYLFSVAPLYLYTNYFFHVYTTG